MGHPSQELQQTESTLHSVIEILIDDQEVLRQVGEELKHEPAKRRLLAEFSSAPSFAESLKPCFTRRARRT